MLLLACTNVLAKDKEKFHSVIVTVSGIKGKALENVNNRLKIVMQPLQATSDANKVNFFYRQANSDIQSSIEPFGYFKATVISTIEHRPPHWYIHFTINPGPAMRISKVRLKMTGPGTELKQFIRYQKHLPIKVGARLDVTAFNKARTSFLDLATKLGFFQAQVTGSHIRINLESYSAQITLKLKTGKRYRFAQTSFSPSPYYKSFLRRFMTYKQGQFYNDNKVQLMRTGLSNSPYFSQVIVSPQPTLNPPPFTVPIKVTTTAAKAQHYTIGGGYGTDTGVRAVASADWLRVTPSGQRINLTTNISQRNDYLTGNYIIPGAQPATSYYTIFSGIGRLDFPSIGKAKSAKFGLSYNTVLAGWNQRIALEYLIERYNIKQLPYSNTHMLIPSINWIKRRTHGGNIPSSGYQINLALSGANKYVISKASFFQSLLTLENLITLPTRTRLILRGEMGYTVIKDLNQLPLSLQFLAGGARSIRGYGYNSIGPGRNILVASGELQQKIWRNLYLVGFYDIGNVSNKYFGEMNQGAGPGVAYLTPIGTFELTVAKALGNQKDKWRVQFSIAPAV